MWAKFKTAVENSGDVTELVQSVLDILDSGVKAEFALNLLELNDPKKLLPPFYILDGLKWLSAQLKERQEDLGLTVTRAAPDAEDQAEA